MRPPDSPPKDGDRCACGHSWGHHRPPAKWCGVPESLATACDVRGCYCLAFVRKPLEAPP